MKKWFGPESPPDGPILIGLNLLDGAIGLGLVSGAAVAAAFGKLLLGGLPAASALAVLARLTRRKRRQRSSQESCCWG